MPISPKIIALFDRRFPDELSCRNHLAFLKWGVNDKEFRCPKCRSNHHKKSQTKTGLFRCSKCDFRISVRRGTIFEGSRLPLKDWLKAIWVMSYHESGINASELKRILGARNYPVVFAMLGKVRQAMGSNNASRLRSDSFEIGTVSLKTVHESSSILVIVERREEGRRIEPGHIRLEKIISNVKKEIPNKISKHLEEGVSVLIDGQISSNVLASWYEISPVEPGERDKTSSLRLVYKVAEELETWKKQNYRNHIRAIYVQQYLDEFAFWWNSRVEFKSDPSVSPEDASDRIFRLLIRLAVRTKPIKLEKNRPGAVGIEPADPL